MVVSALLTSSLSSANPNTNTNTIMHATNDKIRLSVLRKMTEGVHAIHLSPHFELSYRIGLRTREFVYPVERETFMSIIEGDKLPDDALLTFSY